MRGNEPEAAANNQASPHTILAVEDDEALSDLLVQLVKQERPFHALHVPDVEQALEVVRTITPSLFILDYQLLGSDGLELSDRLHAITEFATIPTLMLSAHPPLRKPCNNATSCSSRSRLTWQTSYRTEKTCFPCRKSKCLVRTCSNQGYPAEETLTALSSFGCEAWVKNHAPARLNHAREFRVDAIE